MVTECFSANVVNGIMIVFRRIGKLYKLRKQLLCLHQSNSSYNSEANCSMQQIAIITVVAMFGKLTFHFYKEFHFF